MSMTAILSFLDDELLLVPLGDDEAFPEDDDHDGEHYCVCAGDWTALPCSCRPDFEG